MRMTGRVFQISLRCSFLAHPISQAILADLWMGGLRMRKNPVFKIILGLLCPPSIMKLEFKTREELELMPQTEEELKVAYVSKPIFCCQKLKLFWVPCRMVGPQK